LQAKFVVAKVTIRLRFVSHIGVFALKSAALLVQNATVYALALVFAVPFARRVPFQQAATVVDRAAARCISILRARIFQHTALVRLALSANAKDGVVDLATFQAGNCGVVDVNVVAFLARNAALFSSTRPNHNA
jgi:hypothetical protein